MVEESPNDSDTKKTNNTTIDTSVISTQQKQNLVTWGLPESVLKRYELLGVASMFPWQVECLSNASVLSGGNLIYSAPTSAGKTLVAEILVIKTVLERKKKAIVILPFVSVVREKMFYFQNLLSTSGVRVEGLMGSHSLPGGFKNVDIAICTIEKANGLINRLLEEGSLHKVGAVVVDELHLLGDSFRGYILELLLTKIIYMCKSNDRVKIQIIGMSATLPNLTLLAAWLGAELYRTDFRPVPLIEYLKVGPTVYDNELKKLYDMQPSKDIQDDSDHVVQLCLETVLSGHSVLVFCASKQWCEKLAQHIAQVFRTIGFSGSNLGLKLREELNSSAIAEALEQLRRCPVGLDKILGCTVAFGVAFHHAGLTIDERDIIEGCFRSGTLRVLVATSTLSSGVNLPARRVIVRSPVFQGKSIDPQSYRQMVGRAGRMGQNTAGESFLLCNKGEKYIGEKLVKAELKPVESCLGHGALAASLKRAILEVIASGVASTPEQVEQYTNCTLLATTDSDLLNPISACVQFLVENELIRLQKDEMGLKYMPTPLGLACLAASLPPDDGLQLFDELQRARHCFVLDTDLHVIYEVTPYSVCSQWGNLDWLHVLNLWEQLPPTMQRVGELVGVEERFMVRAMRGTMSFTTSKQVQKLSIHRRFYTALALHDLVNEVPLNEVAKKYGCTRGMLQSLQQSAATFAGMVTAFCRRLGWSSVELLISQFQDRLQFGVHRELCELMKLDGLNGQRARALYDEGITSLAELAIADVCDVENALHKAVPFQSAKEMDGETSFDTKQRNKQRNVWITGHEGLTERDAASLLISEARAYLQKELGLADAKWDCQESDSSGYESLSPVNGSHYNLHKTTKIEDDGQQAGFLCDRTANLFIKSSSSNFNNQTDKIVDNEKQVSVCHQTQEESHTELSDNHKSQNSSKNKKKKATHSAGQSSKTSTLQKVEETKANKGHSASVINDEDCVLSSPSPHWSKKKSLTQMRSSSSYKGGSVRMSGRISRNVSAMKRRNVSSFLKKTESSIKEKCRVTSNIINKNTSQLKTVNDLNEIAGPSEIEVSVGVQLCSTKKDDDPISAMKKKELEPDAASKEVQSSNKNCNDGDESIDYFETSLDISEQKLHIETQQYRLEVERPQKSNLSSSNNISENNGNSKNLFLKTFLSSLRVVDNVDKTNPFNKNNQGIVKPKEPLKEMVESHEMSKQNISYSPISSPEQVGELEKNMNTSMGSQRQSSDFCSTPQVIEKHTDIEQIEDPSPSLFGDSFIVDTQLDEVLEACDKNNDECPKDPTVCNGEMSPEHKAIPTNCKTEVNSKLENHKEGHNSKMEENLPSASSEKFKGNKSIKSNISKNIVKKKINKGNLSKNKCMKTLSEGIVTTRDVINLNWGIDKETSLELCDSDESIDSENKNTKSFRTMQANAPTTSNVIKGSIVASVNNEMTVVNSIHSEELFLQSLDEESLLPSPIPKENKGLLKQKTYNLNKTLRSMWSVKNSLMRKRKPTASFEIDDFEQELNKSKKIKIAEETCQNKLDVSFKPPLEIQDKASDCKKSTALPSSNHNETKGNRGINDEHEQLCIEVDGDPISDSFLEKAFDTYWELGSETEENDGNKIQEEKLESNENGIPIENARTDVPAYSRDEKKDTNENVSMKTKNKEHIDGTGKTSEDPCIITDSLFEGAFSSCWGETEDTQGKHNSNLHCTSQVSQNSYNKVENEIASCEIVTDENAGNSISCKNEVSKKSQICKRRSPRFMEASNKDKIMLASEDVEEIKNIPPSKADYDFKILRSRNVLEPTGKPASLNVNIGDGKIGSPMKFSEVPIMQASQQKSASKTKHTPTQKARTPTAKDILVSPVINKANKILHFSDSSSEDDKDDLVNSSLGDDMDRRSKLEDVRLKISIKGAQNCLKSPASPHKPVKVTKKPPSGVLGTKSYHIGKKQATLRMWDSLNIIDVCGHERIWKAFQAELCSTSVPKVAFAVACEKFIQPTAIVNKSGGIGARIIGVKQKKPKNLVEKNSLHYNEQLVTGIALCFGAKDVFFISLKKGEQSCKNLQSVLDTIQEFFKRNLFFCAFDLKEHLKTLVRCCKVAMYVTTGHDPKVADWLIEPEEREKNFSAMVLQYCGNEATKLADLVGTSWGVGSPSLDWRSSTPSRLRACVEAVLSWQLVEKQLSALEEKNFINVYADVEMPTLLCLTRMELNGIRFDRNEAERLRDLLGKQLTLLEDHAYKLAGHTFSLTSSSDIAQVLYRELGLTSGKLSYKQLRPSTSKEALLKIKNDHPLPGIILQWRKLNSVVTKTVFPLLAPGLTSGRMFTCSVIHSATGRISMHEPNLQNIPRDFDVVIDKQEGKSITLISMRLAFVPSAGNMFVSADYSQLELRILAHLAKDSVLSSILNSDCDVFRNIAASWNKISEPQVTNEQRQWAKQVCYGIIYGMGAKALGEQLDVDEEDAGVFMETFKNSYKGVKQYLMQTVELCRREGYVETLLGRRRYLSGIHSPNSAIRAQAERQAVNTTVQGSAADVAKTAMVLVDLQLKSAGFTSCGVGTGKEKEASLVLHIHDELLYEVSCDHLMEAARIIKDALENAVTLSVKLPVKVKVGESWGSIKEISL